MRAAQIRRLGGTPELAELDPPSRQPGQVVVETRAVALNPLDVAVASGRSYAGTPPRPYVPGCEAAGRVIDGETLAAGTRVYMFGDGLGVRRDGTLAERVAALEETAIPLPGGVDDPLAVAAGIAGLAGWLPLTLRAPVGPNDRVLVLGATGTVGSVAVQAARILGAGRVVAAGRNEQALERTTEFGADATVRLGTGGANLAKRFVEACGGVGPSVVIDPLWGSPLVAALEAADRGARIVHIGQSAGAEASIASSLVRGKQLEILGYTTFSVPREDVRQGYLDLIGHVAAGRIRIDVETVAFDKVDKAWERQKDGPGTKLVVTL